MKLTTAERCSFPGQRANQQPHAWAIMITIGQPYRSGTGAERRADDSHFLVLRIPVMLHMGEVSSGSEQQRPPEGGEPGTRAEQSTIRRLRQPLVGDGALDRSDPSGDLFEHLHRQAGLGLQNASEVPRRQDKRDRVRFGYDCCGAWAFV
jgi:hypothetical protein